MKSEKKPRISSETKKWLIIIALIVFYIAMFLTTRFINMFSVVIPLGKQTLDGSSICGLISALMIFSSISMVMVDYRKGAVFGVSVQAISVVMLSASIVTTGNLRALPGVAMLSLGVIMVLIQYKLQKHIQLNELKLLKNSITDPLTGLPNRRGMTAYIDNKISENKPFYLLFFDLDNFKGVNDSLGHKAGDRLLCTVADRWRGIKGQTNYLARNGGDEFIMIFNDGNENKLCDFINDCLEVLGNEIKINECSYYASVSIGAARFPEHGTDSDSLLKSADMAMYQAKRTKKSHYAIFDESMSELLERQMKYENIIRTALTEKSFYFMYQPQFYTKGKALRGFEALLRLKDENGNFVNTGELISTAEKSGLILEIDRYVLENVTREFADIAIGSGRKFIVSINISARQLSDRGFADMVGKVLDETDFPPECFEIEITEYCFVGSLERALESIKALKNLGVSIALDDFGTGYASLSNLSRLPIDLLKIDKSFIDRINDDKSAEGLATAIVSLGHLFNCEVIAEGVEYEKQLSMLNTLGCECIQGYIWGKPAVKAEVIGCLDNAPLKMLKL